MDVFIARQPIFDAKQRVAGYELLYRDGAGGNRASFTDGDRATCQLLSDAITRFGLSRLTDQKPAFVNFTENLLLNDFVLLADPREVAVELLEDIRFTDRLLEKLKELKERGYTLALDDYTGESGFASVLPYVDILKVDFLLTPPERRAEIAREMRRYKGVRLLAEKVETREEFERAADQGYQLFQGYFFEKPLMFQKKLPPMAVSSYARILRETQRAEMDFQSCAQIIRSDAVLTYQVLQKVRRLEYYRGNMITAIQQALVLMGTNELRRWCLLLLARENNVTQCDELVRRSYLRGIFAEALLEQIPGAKNCEDGFLLGMFSLMDKILGESMAEILEGLELHGGLVDALLDRGENQFSRLLRYVEVYETGDPGQSLPEAGVTLSPQEVARVYMRCLEEVDRTFREVGDGPT